ncbi:MULTISPECIES: archaea-specific SMC-related protein [Halorussus]|uniref:archaea-specific SMC-related protein n=1 Tax=Halorussus TaxID=1070314 RepID=UPI00209D8C7E|nr:archaea-specific SMC-related protein [Halorussus vallis]USZ77873.1 AAA family ATPase [Halorussus vallis]
MNQSTAVETEASVSVRNIGGIDETEVELVPGVTVLKGRNATNRTSFLRSIKAALGSDEDVLKGDADRGRVELTIGDETYVRTFVREDGTVRAGGSPYLSDATPAELFAFLLEDNEARRAVARGDDLRDVIMRPVDTADVERQIREAEREKDELDEELERCRSREQRLPELERERASLRESLSAKREELEALRDEIETLDAGVDETREQRAEVEERLSELGDARSDLEKTRRRLDSEREQLESLKGEREELREEREELPTSIQEISDLGHRIGELRERKRTLDSLLDQLQNIIKFNQEVLEGSDSELREALVPENDEHVSAQLLAEDTELVCWTCGSHVERGEVERTVEDLRELHREKLSQRKEASSQLDDLREEKQTVEKRQQRREQIEHQLERIDDQIEQRRERIDDLRNRREELTDRVATLEETVEELRRDDSDDRILELSKRASQLELEAERIESDLEETEAEIESIESDLEEIPRIEAERERVREHLTELRERIGRIEEEAVTAFNEHMDELLDILEYGNLERIWIERRDETVQKGRRRVDETTFDLHVVRTTPEGRAYEDTVDHLSESEREVTGLVFGLAGYLAHEVYRTVPFMLLDSLEAIDPERIAALVDYFETYAPHLVVALLPEDAEPLDDAYPRITDI